MVHTCNPREVGRLRQENQNAILGYIIRTCLKKQMKKKGKKKRGLKVFKHGTI
jgi:hypothetical protein